MRTFKKNVRVLDEPPNIKVCNTQGCKNPAMITGDSRDAGSWRYCRGCATAYHLYGLSRPFEIIPFEIYVLVLEGGP